MFFHSPAILPALITGACCMVEAATAEPAGTSWQLVQIKSMDDRTDVPEDRAQYTLALYRLRRRHDNRHHVTH